MTKYRFDFRPAAPYSVLMFDGMFACKSRSAGAARGGGGTGDAVPVAFSRSASAFTLIELLVCLAIITVLTSLLIPALGRAKNLATRASCLSNLHQIGLGTSLYLSDHGDRMPWVADGQLQLTPPVNASGKRYNSMGSFMPLLDVYVGTTKVWESPPARLEKTDTWRLHFASPWREHDRDFPEKGWANYISDKLAEKDPEQSRFLRGRTPESCANKRGTSVSTEEWLMTPFFERGWWKGFGEMWSVGSSAPPAKGWSAHMGGRNQLYLDFHADWVRKDIAP